MAENEPDVFIRDFYEPFGREVYHHVYRMTDSAEDAEDVFQETAIKAWRKHGDVGEERRAWLHRVAHNTALDLLRQKKRADMQDLDTLSKSREVDENVVSPEESAIIGEDHLELREALSRVKPHFRKVLIFDSQGLTDGEIGVAIGKTRQATKSLLHKARILLRCEFLEPGSTLNRTTAELVAEDRLARKARL